MHNYTVTEYSESPRLQQENIEQICKSFVQMGLRCEFKLIMFNWTVMCAPQNMILHKTSEALKKLNANHECCNSKVHNLIVIGDKAKY